MIDAKSYTFARAPSTTEGLGTSKGPVLSYTSIKIHPLIDLQKRHLAKKYGID